MSDVEIIPAQKLVKKSDAILEVTDLRQDGSEGLTRHFNFLSDKRQIGETVQNFRNLSPLEAAEAEVLRERFRNMGGKPRLSPANLGAWH